MAAPGNANDKRVSLLRDIVENLKNDKVVWEPVVKAAEKYQAALKLLIQSSNGLIEAINVVGERASSATSSSTSDLGVGIHQIAAGLRSIEASRAAVAKSLTDDLINPLSSTIQSNKNNAVKFEKDYLKEHKRIVGDIKKAETESGKAAKKGPEALKAAIARVNDTVKEMEILRQTKLREAIVEGRKRYCFFIMHIATVLGHDTTLHDSALRNVGSKLSEWTQLAVSPDNLPPAVEALVTVQQRTFVPIQPGQEASSAGYSSYYAEEEEYYEEAPAPPQQHFGGGGYHQQQPSYAQQQSYSSPAQQSYSSPAQQSYSSPAQQSYASPAMQSYGAPAAVAPPQDNVLRPGDKCVALYDYQGDPDKLSFAENAIIVVQEVDPSGWCLGAVNGAVGWFPSNYVEKVQPPAPAPAPAAPRAPPMMAPVHQQSYAAPPQQQQHQQSYQPSLARKPSMGSNAMPQPAATTGGPPPPPSKAGKYGQGFSQGAAGIPPPPPAPVAAPAPPPPPPVSSGGSGGGSGGRGALLNQIQGGGKGGLRKVQTNDRSTPKFK